MTLNDDPTAKFPPALAGILAESKAIGFGMASEPKVGALLATLAASKPGGRFLELGTGTGHGTAWLLSGMDETSHLDTVDVDETVSRIARRHLEPDPRVTFHRVDAAEFVENCLPGWYDLIYADAWPGKYTHLDQTLSLLRVGGFYVVDDLLPQANWPGGHAANVPRLVEALDLRPGFTSVRLEWASGLMLVVRAVEAWPTRARRPPPRSDTTI
jgi:predicted O-methyltransferase YrrM